MSSGPAGVILLDAMPGADEKFGRRFLERVGHQVIVCNGPEVTSPCPLLVDGECESFQGAHGVLFELDLDRPDNRAVLQEYLKLAGPDLPVRAVVSPDQAQKYADLLAGVEIWTSPPSAADLDGFAAAVEAVDRDLG